ncbi:MAG: hypothetical protein ACE5FL_04985 [Myxococcota bacterium]
MGDDRRAFATIFLLSATVVMLQVVLARLMIGLVYNAFYYFPIAVALLGLSGGGVYLYANRDRMESDPATLYTRYIRWALWASVALVVAVLVISEVGDLVMGSVLDARSHQQGFDGVGFFFESRIPLLVCYGAASVLPFYFLGVAIAAIFRAQSPRINTVYFIDLTGATVGALLGIVVLDHVESFNYLIVATALVALSLAIWDRMGRVYLGILLAVFAAVQTLGAPAFDAVTLRAVRYWTKSTVVHTRWVASAYMQLAQKKNKAGFRVLQDHDSNANGIEFTPGRRPESGELPTWIAGVRALNGDAGSICVIAAGLGRQMLQAYDAGFDEIYGVEMNHSLAPFAEAYKPRSHLSRFFREPGVHYIREEARHFLRTTDRKFDVIMIPPAGAAQIAATLSPSHMFTEEAIVDYLGHLSERGVFVTTVRSPWSEEGHRRRAAFLSLIRGGLQRAGIRDLDAHVFMIGRITFISKPIVPASRLDEIGATPFSEIAETVPPFDGRVTDDRPFLDAATTYHAQWRLFVDLLRGRGSISPGGVALAATVIAIVLAGAVVGWPLLRRRPRRGSIEREDVLAVAYFGLLGGAFMFIEIPLIEKLVFALGNPVYSISFCLAVLLASTGLGSIVSARLLRPMGEVRRARLNAAFLALIAVVLCMPVGLRAILSVSLGSSGLIPFLVIGLAIFPLGLLLGVPFPHGLWILGRQDRSALVPWAWAANGAVSVVAANVSAILARIEGISAMFLVAAILYLLAFAVLNVAILPAARNS